MAIETLDLDLSDQAQLPSVSVRYDAVRFLVRLRGVPLGLVQLPNRHPDTDAAAIRSRCVSSLAREIWAALNTERFSVGSGQAFTAERISVVVCTRDRAARLQGCLEALTQQQYPSYEVVVVDNASRDDDTRKVAQRYGVRYAREDRPGLDWARNRGIAEAVSPIIAFTDDDARPDPDWLEAVAAGFASPDVAAVTGLVVAAALETPAQWMYEDWYGGMRKGFRPLLHSRRGRPMTYTPNRYGAGCNMAFRRDALERLGGFDPALDVGTRTGGGGDLDMFQRVLESGAAVAYRPDAVVRHIHRSTIPTLRRQLFDNGRAFSAVLWSALLRARGRERLRVINTYIDWFYWWHVRRLARRLFRRGEPMPIRLILAELGGAPLGPLLYPFARRHANRLANLPDGK